MIIKTTKGTWNLHGINLLTSDAIYQIVKDAIETDNLGQDYLQKVTGHLAPITVNIPEKTILFSSF